MWYLVFHFMLNSSSFDAVLRDVTFPGLKAQYSSKINISLSKKGLINLYMVLTQS